jgi:hypothetical protein
MLLSLNYGPDTHQEEYLSLLHKGMGTTSPFPQTTEDGKNIACWGWRKGEALLKKDPERNVLVVERGYLGNREEWTSLGWNGLNGYANFNNESVPDDRWIKYWKNGMQPWQPHDGEYILICGQIITDMSLSDCQSYETFVFSKIEHLKARYGKQIRFRPHPLAKKTGRNRIYVPKDVQVVDASQTTLTDDMKNAKLVVAWNSNSLVEAMYLGIPFESNSPGSMVHSYQQKDPFEEPNRNDWGRRIAYCQWNKEELANGVAWKHVQRSL